MFLGFIWLPSRKTKVLYEELKAMKEADKEAEMPRLIKMERHEYSSITPPTLINTNEFTSVF